MKKFLFILAIGLIVSTGAMADVQNGTPSHQTLTSGHGANNPRVSLTSSAVVELEPTQRPRSVSGSGSGEVNLAVTPKPGPRSDLSGATMSSGDIGGAGVLDSMVSPRGGAMMSPQQRADREIRRLITRLD